MKTFILSIVFMLNLNAMAKIQQLELRYEKAVKFGNAVTFTLPYFESEGEVYPFVIPQQPLRFYDCDRLIFLAISWEPYICVDVENNNNIEVWTDLSGNETLEIVGTVICKAFGYKSGKINSKQMQITSDEYHKNYDLLQRNYKRFAYMNIRTGSFEIIRSLSGQAFERMTELTCYE